VHLFIYNIFLFLYSLGIRITSLWNPKARSWRNGRKNIWAELQKTLNAERPTLNAEGKEPNAKRPVRKPKIGAQNVEGELPQEESNSPLTIDHSPLVWMHCSSLGEFEQGRPVMEAIRQQYPNVKVLLTFFSPSGYEVRKNNSGADYVTYLPIDSRSTSFNPTW
jgi:3-deoxy-D-manno-octulosonic-acid transferase